MKGSFQRAPCNVGVVLIRYAIKLPLLSKLSHYTSMLMTQRLSSLLILASYLTDNELFFSKVNDNLYGTAPNTHDDIPDYIMVHL